MVAAGSIPVVDQQGSEAETPLNPPGQVFQSRSQNRESRGPDLAIGRRALRPSSSARPPGSCRSGGVGAVSASGADAARCKVLVQACPGRLARRGRCPYPAGGCLLAECLLSLAEVGGVAVLFSSPLLLCPPVTDS